MKKKRKLVKVGWMAMLGKKVVSFDTSKQELVHRRPWFWRANEVKIVPVFVEE